MEWWVKGKKVKMVRELKVILVRKFHRRGVTSLIMIFSEMSSGAFVSPFCFTILLLDQFRLGMRLNNIKKNTFQYK